VDDFIHYITIFQTVTLLYVKSILRVMKLVAKEWEITIDVFSFKAEHIGCDREATMFNSDGRPSSSISEHDEDSYCVCGCAIISPKLKEFKIITESI